MMVKSRYHIFSNWTLNVLEIELAIWKIFYLEVFGMFCFDGFVLFSFGIFLLDMLLFGYFFEAAIVNDFCETLFVLPQTAYSI